MTSGIRCCNPDCQHPIESLSTAWKEVIGYVAPKGADSMIGRRDTGGLLCSDCALAIRMGIKPGQQALV